MPLSLVFQFFYSQFFIIPPYPSKKFTDQTVIVTGSNTGLGFEAAQHFVRLGASKVILAVRTVEKGEAARKRIEESTGRTSVVEVWQLELESYESVKAFAEKAQGLDRLDVLMENAGIILENFRMAGEDEATMTVNVTSTFLLAILLLPKMQETSAKYNTQPRLSVVSSGLHFSAPFNERKADNIFEELSRKETMDMSKRYPITKLLEVLAVRELASISTLSGKPRVIINCLTPGACRSDFGRESGGWLKTAILGLIKLLIARTTEVGSRTLVAAAEAGEESHGEYMANGKVAQASPFVCSAEGLQTQKRVWAELARKLERISPGILENIYTYVPCWVKGKSEH